MRHLLHKAICWYLRRCSGAFHCYNYGPQGRYVAMMNERQYHRYMALANCDKTGETLMEYKRLCRHLDEVA
jgi:hypothetical protein